MPGTTSKIMQWFADRVAVRKIVDPIMGFTGYDWPIGYKRKENPEVLIQKYRGWVFECVRRNAQAVAQTPLRLYVTTKRGDSSPKVATKEVLSQSIKNFATQRGPFIRQQVSQALRVEEVLEHPFLDLMTEANPIMDGFEVLETIQTYQELIGTAYVYKVKDSMGVLREIWPLLSHKVGIIPHKTKFISHYEYGDGPDKVKFQPNEIAKFRFPNPESYYVGMSPLAAAATPVDMQLYMDQYEEALFRNKARPDQVLIPTVPIRRDVRRRIESEFNKVMRGVTKQGKTLVLPHGFTLEQLNFSPKELSFLLGRKTTRDDIASIFDIPATLLTSDAGSRSKDEAAEYMHAKYGVWPRVRRLEQRLNQDIVSEYDSRLFCAFDNPVPEDKEFALKKRTADLRSGTLVINETREEEGLKPVPWGSEPLLTQNVIPLSEAVANQKASREKKQASNDGKDPNTSPLDDTKPGRQKDTDGDKNG